MPTSITTIPRHRIHALEEGCEIVVKRAGKPDRNGKFAKLSNGQFGIRCEDFPVPIVIEYDARVLLVERT